MTRRRRAWLRAQGRARRAVLQRFRGRLATGSAARRPRGTGALFVKRDGAWRETWYGKWRVGKVQVKRRIGPKRIPSTREGLTRTQAEAELRRLIGAIDHAAVQRERVTVEEVGELLVASVRAKGRKRSTLRRIARPSVSISSRSSARAPLTRSVAVRLRRSWPT
jgi:hypothetical protein